MGLLRNSSKKEGGRRRSSSSGAAKVKLTKEDAAHLKYRTGNVHDPILSAVNEAQPFEQAATSNNRLSLQAYVMQNKLPDVWGQTIEEYDVSNPTRPRNERPLDTIRSFEYAITGDRAYIDQLETHKYGFAPRNTFMPSYSSNPYGYQGDASGNGGAPAPAANYSQPVYQPKTTPEVSQKKKKRGLFGRRRK